MQIDMYPSPRLDFNSRPIFAVKSNGSIFQTLHHGSNNERGRKKGQTCPPIEHSVNLASSGFTFGHMSLNCSLESLRTVLILHCTLFNASNIKAT